MIGARAFGRQQQEDQIDRLTIERLEIDRSVKAGKQAKQTIELRQLAMRDRNAVSNPGGTELLALQQGFENRAFAETAEFGRTCSNFLNRLLLAVDPERRDHRIHGHDVVKRHWKRSAYPPVKWLELGLLGLKSGGP
jgi:hypothetical protein